MYVDADDGLLDEFRMTICFTFMNMFVTWHCICNSLFNDLVSYISGHHSVKPMMET